jgi:hemin uptake protein HemP
MSMISAPQPAPAATDARSFRCFSRSVGPQAATGADAAGLTPAMPATARVVESERLLQGGNEVLIRHGGETYRLRHTRNDKLILTK